MKLKKELVLLDVFCISSGAMISSGLFILPALVYAKSGPSVILIYILAGLLFLPTVLTKAELASAMPKTGGFFFFTDRSMGPMAGTLGGLSAWFSLAFKSAFALLGMGIFLELFFPGLDTLYVKLIAVGFCVFFTVINILGVKLAARFQIIMVFALFGLLILYIIRGLYSIEPSNYTPFAPYGFKTTIATIGLVFISFAGTTKVVSVAGEVKDPGRNLPRGMLLSWGVVSLLYVLVIFITIGVVNPGDLESTNMPISIGGEVMMGTIGLVLMSIAAVLAYVSTGNSGILAASRDPMAMGKGGLLPKDFSKVSKMGTPWFAILVTSGFMIVIILFLDLEEFIKLASTLKLIVFILGNLALIFMRQSHLPHYRPMFKAPLYPFLQVLAIIVYIILIVMMGLVPVIFVLIFFILGIGWYRFFARGKIKREYALLNIIKKHFDTKPEHKLDEELREIMIDFDNVSELRFEKKLKHCPVLDLNYFAPPGKFSEQVSKNLAKHMKMDQKKLYERLIRRERDSNILANKNIAIISFQIKQENKFELALVRTKQGAMFNEDGTPVHATFIIVASPDEQSFYLHSLMWIVQISETPEFQKKWMNAKTKKDLRRVVLNMFIEQCNICKEKPSKK
jgi:amino acid transporter/mannitol/fructose-specific phosphotransferase system IIA component (Ntr-type)